MDDDEIYKRQLVSCPPPCLIYIRSPSAMILFFVQHCVFIANSLPLASLNVVANRVPFCANVPSPLYIFLTTEHYRNLHTANWWLLFPFFPPPSPHLSTARDIYELLFNTCQSMNNESDFFVIFLNEKLISLRAKTKGLVCAYYETRLQSPGPKFMMNITSYQKASPKKPPMNAVIIITWSST